MLAVMPAFPPALLPLALIGAAPEALPPDALAILLGSVADRMTVPVRVAGAGPYPFIIDTGSERTVIARQLARALRLPAGRGAKVIAMSGTARVATVTVPSIQLSSIPAIGAIEAPALDAANLGGLGLLGIDTLQGHKVSIDFDAGVMTVSRSDPRARRERREPGEIVVRARSQTGQLIVTDADVEGRRVRVVLDTGSALTIGNTPLQRLMRRDSRALRPLELISVIGEPVQTRYGTASRLRLGGVAFTGVPIAFADVPPFDQFGLSKRPAMLLGMDALKFFRRVDIDFANREIRFLLPRGAQTAACRTRLNDRCAD
ncbi:Aspartyl protease [Sphingomonas guangdongensis]|uniref:Aspartyl protease n=1 Tax=Sphingomonas guangdongensis TaxID=1141890 RepID=A0A285QD93_9SPHN|nr:retroviral-like aspartic protease family protein [Sphingomonas guangdongensis]SOB79910.1 Aspartyl protease [Sphingomonas guangdongensis]